MGRVATNREEYEQQPDSQLYYATEFSTLYLPKLSAIAAREWSSCTDEYKCGV